MGDVKLLAMLGAFFGWPGVFFIVAVSAFIGSAVGLTTIWVLRNQPEPEPEPETDEGEADDGISLRGHYLPFGPYLCLGGLVVMFAGTWAYDFYFAFLDIGP
jgi:leader peptidase (prepilin peptidase) / N-methyltransferase